jgi:hypothetical protein
LATQRKYTRHHSDPDPPQAIDNLEGKLCKISKKVTQSGIFLDRVLTFPKGGVEIIDDLKFDIKSEQPLFRSNLESYLTEIVFDEKKFQTFIPTVPITIVVIPNQII